MRLTTRAQALLALLGLLLACILASPETPELPNGAPASVVGPGAQR